MNNDTADMAIRFPATAAHHLEPAMRLPPNGMIAARCDGYTIVRIGHEVTPFKAARTLYGHLRRQGRPR